MPHFDYLLPAPFGYVGIAVARNGEIIELLTESVAVKAQAHPRALEMARQIANYLASPHALLSLPNHRKGTSFQQRVWHAIAQIPVGQTITYAQLADRVQSGPRAVANACGANPTPLLVPCHRVVASHGLGGFMQGHPQGLAIKRWLLQHEHIVNEKGGV